MKNKKGNILANLFNPKFLILIAIVIIIYFGFIATGSFLTGDRVTSTTAKLIAEDDKSATYEFSFVSNGQPKSDCDNKDAISWDFDAISRQATSTLPMFVDGLVENTYFDATSSEINGITAVYNSCSNLEQGAQVYYDSSTARCQIAKESTKYARITCNFVGSASARLNNEKVPANFRGLTGGMAVVTFPKQGHENEIQQLSTSSSQEQNVVSTSSTGSSDSGYTSTPQTGNTDVTSSQPSSSNSLLSKITVWVQNLIDKILGVLNK